MVFNPDSLGQKERLTAFLTAKLTSEQLDAIQHAFGRGSFSQSPNCPTELFIKDNSSYHSLSLEDIRRAEPDLKPLLIIDSKSPVDGGIWYIDDFASEDEVEDEEAVSTNVLWKIRMKAEDICIMHAGYDVANASIVEDLANCGVDYPVPEAYEQPTLHSSGIDPSEDMFIAPTWVTVEPEEYEETTDPKILKTFSSRPEKMYRLKPEIAKQHGLKPVWTLGSKARDREMPDGTTRTFPDGSLVLQLNYDIEGDWSAYQKPEGSL